MYKIILLFLISFSAICNAASLEFKLNLKLIAKVNAKEFHKGLLHFNKKQIKAIDQALYNAWRGMEISYKGYPFFELLDLYFTQDWRNASTIAFVSLDGYVQKVKIQDLLKAAQNKTGYLAYSESGKDGFTKFTKGEKLIDPSPFYLVWSNFTEGDRAKHSDTLKWPYQLKTIIITQK
ncbi:MAG: hypothetical protein U0T83_08685 [Bacteriovoracaceae bacterium]